MEQTVFLTLFLAVLCVLVIVPIIVFENASAKRERLRLENLRKVVRGSKIITTNQFFSMRESYRGRLTELDFVGAYVICNIDKKLFYVGQSVHVFNRINAHFTGKGNGDVYADYKYGDRFEIRMVKLQGSGYDRLDDLERELIEMYHCCERGYNRKKGNR